MGPVPSGGMNQIKQHVASACSFVQFSKFHPDKTLLKELKNVDAAVAQFFTREMVEAADSLRLLHAVGAGVDEFCLPALSSKTTVCNVYYHGPAIAEYVMMMVLALGRDLPGLNSALHKGAWTGSWIWGNPPADEACGKSIGIIGFGHIGRELATRAAAFGMTVRVLSAHPKNSRREKVKFWGGPDDLQEVLSLSDYVVISCPLDDQTRGMIGAKQFRWMKSDACLINIARAPIVDELALYQALKTRRIRGAAIDVWYRYPRGEQRLLPSKYPFHQLPNIIMTPHIAGWSSGTFRQRFRTIASNLDRLATGRPFINRVYGSARQLGLHP